MFIWYFFFFFVNVDFNENYENEEDSDDYVYDGFCVVIVVGGERGDGWVVSYCFWSK